MGWLIVGLLMITILTVVARINHKRTSPGRHRVADVAIYDRVERACRESSERQGEFEIDLHEISDLDWLEIGNHEFTKDQFRAVVKWRNQGNQCIYKFVATAGSDENAVTKQSPRNVIPLNS